MKSNFQIPRLMFASLVVGGAAGCAESTTDKINDAAAAACNLRDCEFDYTASEKAECVSDTRDNLHDQVDYARDEGASTSCIHAILDYAACEANLSLKQCEDKPYDENDCDHALNRYYDLCDY
jgi:hypothetical protein